MQKQFNKKSGIRKNFEIQLFYYKKKKVFEYLTKRIVDEVAKNQAFFKKLLIRKKLRKRYNILK